MPDILFGCVGAVVGSYLNNAITYVLNQSTSPGPGPTAEFWIGFWTDATSSASASDLVWVDFSKNPTRVKPALITWNQVVVDAGQAESATRIAITPDGTLQGRVYLETGFLTTKGLSSPPPGFVGAGRKDYEFQMVLRHNGAAVTRYHGFQAEITAGTPPLVTIF